VAEKFSLQKELDIISASVRGRNRRERKEEGRQDKGGNEGGDKVI
jgi:hypothetical protein